MLPHILRHQLLAVVGVAVAAQVATGVVWRKLLLSLTAEDEVKDADLVLVFLNAQA